MEFKIDKSEIIENITSVYELESKSNNSKIIDRICDDIEDSFLKLRARYLYSEYKMEPNFQEKINRLQTVCYENNPNCEDCPISKYCNYFINKMRNAVSSENLKMVDLFCGAGGLSLGFKQEGFITYLANDIEECCVDTYAHNHPETPRERIVLGDIQNLVNELKMEANIPKVDIVVGGPPCQGFSMANRQRLIDDPRNQLYRNYVEIVKILKPTFFVMENVKGMLTVADQVKEDFEKAGYSVEYRVLNAKDFGVPQNRERLIYIGNRIDISNVGIFNEIEKVSSTIPNFFLKDAIYGLRALEASRNKNATNTNDEISGRRIEKRTDFSTNEYLKLINLGNVSKVVYNHKARYNNDRDIEIYGRLNQGDRSDDPKIADIMPYKNRNHIFKDKYFKLESNKVSKTITAHMKFDCNMYIHPTQARGLTPREAARIQSYPDDYYFRGAYTKTYMQIGNSVPPLLGRTIAAVIKKYMKGE